MENDPVFQSGFDLRPGFQLHAVEYGIDVAQRFHLHLQSESDFQRAFTCPRALQLHFVGVSIHPHENLRQRNVFLGVEILRQLLIAEHLIADQNALARINPAKTAARQRPATHRNILRAVIFQQNQIVIAKGQQPIVVAQAFQHHVGIAVVAKGERFQRRSAALIDRRIANPPRHSVDKRCRSPAPPCRAAT